MREDEGQTRRMRELGKEHPVKEQALFCLGRAIGRWYHTRKN